MSASDGKIDFDAVHRNATEQGIPLSEIAIIYENLTEDEISVMEQHRLVTHRNEDKLMAKFTNDGVAMFPEKAVGVYSLAS